ncbi:MAG: hypothetical protein IKJ66_10330 [Bacteroidaceae bacterium]|nr:hypothetical protein [Bacteroidaceae bacterium]
MSKSNVSRVLSVLLLAIVAVMIGQGRAYAASTFTVTNSDNTFTVTRRGNTAVAEDVNYRTVSLSAIEGQHFTVASGTLSFAANDTSKTVTVTESTPGTDAYKFQSGTTRSYRFEVLDSDGYILASKDRSMTTGTSVPSSGAFDIKDVTIYSSEYTANDDGYDKNGYKSVSSSGYFTSSNAPKAYLQQISAQLRMTLSFQGKENDDAYEYLQLLFDNTSTCDNRSGCSNGDPGNISLSTYMAGFEMNTGGKDDTYRDYTFPVTSVGNNEGATDPWGYDTKWPLSKQKFNSSRASDGRIIMPINFSSIVLRLNASGSSGSDEWAVKNVTAHIQAVDATAPTVLNNYKVSGGRHQKGNVIYVSVAFSEIVNVTGTPTLATSWGTLSYCAGSGSNVLTFRGEISSDAAGTFIVTSYSGTIKDLAGNAFSGTISKDYGTSLDADYAWTEADFNSLGTNTYEIATKTDLRHLALLVNAAKNPCSGLTFQQTQDITCDNTYTPIGYYVSGSDEAEFRGTYDGQGYTISGITVSREADGNIGVFGRLDYVNSTDYGTVKNVVLASSIFTGGSRVGGIVGYNRGGTVENCRVESTVTINAGNNYAHNHGGIVGYNVNYAAKVIGCYSAATISKNGKINCQYYGGIVGYNYHGTVKDCLYAGTTVTAANKKGAIIGYDEYNYGVFSNNYYTAISLGGVGADGSSSDQDGARRARTVTLGTNVALSGSQTAYSVSGLTAIGTTALQSGETIYSGEGQTVNVAYSGTVPEGFMVIFSTTGGILSGTTLTIPDGDVTVSATCSPDYATHWHADADHDGSSAERAYIITTTTGLNLLATLVNGYGYSTFEGTYFLLGNDITYTHTTDWNNTTSTENNYTAIGSWRSGTTYNQFKGSFDGDGHTISGIRIYKPESSTGNGYQGLFGYVGTGGSIHDVNLADARITGQLSVAGIAGLSYGTVTNCTVAADVLVASKHTGSHYHAGIVGNNHGTVSGCTSTVTLTAAYTGPYDYGAVVGINYSDGTVENCLALGATIPAMQDCYGVIVGYNSSGTLTANYYRDCTVGTTANAVGVGAGKSGGAPTDVDGARSVHNLTLPDGVTVTGESVEISSITYYAAATDVTLSCTGTAPAGYVEPCYYTVDGTNISGNTFTMPASDATVALLWTTDYETGHAGTEADPYIISDYPQLELLASRVNSVNHYSQNKHFKLGNDIVCFDGENNHTPIGVHVTNKHFSGTFDGDGHTVSGIRISSSTGYQGLFGYLSGATVKNVTLAGSTIIGHDEVGGIVGYSFTGTFENCRVLGDVTIKANASSAYYHGGIVGNISGGGTVNGCYSAATVTRDGNSNCKHYGGIVGKTNGTVSNCIALGAWVTGSETSSSGAIVGTNDGGTLTHNYYYDCSVKSYVNNVGTGSGDVSENDGAVQANAILSESETVPTDLSGTVAFRREFTGGKASTICLPFAMTTISGGKVYEFVDVTYDATDGWVATMSDATPGGNNVTTTEANKPYLFLPDATGAAVFGGAADYNVSDGLATTSGDWTFIGTYSRLTYGTAPFSGTVFGFAATGGKANDGQTDVTAGQFIKAATGAYIQPFRAYLTYSGSNSALQAPSRQVQSDVMPDRITVRLTGKGGGTTAVGTIDTATGEVTIERWFNLNGEPVEGTPLTPGLYLNSDGRKVLISE